MTQALPKKLRFQFSTRSFFVLSIYVFFAGLGIWQSFLPFFAERHYRDGYMFEVQQRLNYAIEEYELAVEDAPWETQYMIDLAKTYSDYAMKQSDIKQKQDYLKKSETLALKTISYDKKNPWFKNRLAAIYLLMAEVNPSLAQTYMQDAETYTRQAADADNKNPLFKINLAYFLHRIGKTDEAILFYKKAVQLDDRMAEARFNMADIYQKRGDLMGVLKEYETVVSKDPNFANINLALASVYVQLHQKSHDPTYLRKAALCLEREKIKTPSNKEVLKNLVAIYTQLQDWPHALAHYHYLEAHDPDLFHAYHPFYLQALSMTKKSGVK